MFLSFSWGNYPGYHAESREFTSPSCACSSCEEPGGYASGTVSESDIAIPRLFQLCCATL